MLKKEYGIDAVVFLKYFCINYDKDGDYVYVKAKDEDLKPVIRESVTADTIAYFSRLAKEVGRVRRRPNEQPSTTQTRALMRLVNSINVVRHQRVPVFTRSDGSDFDIKMVKLEYDTKVTPIGKQGLFNLKPTRIFPSFPFYPPLTKRIKPDKTVVGIVSKYCAEEYPNIPLEVWQFWNTLTDYPLDQKIKICVCGECRGADYAKWSRRCADMQAYNPLLPNSIQTPLWFIHNSIASGTSVDQVCTTLSLMERVEGFKPNIEKEYLIAAVLSYLKEMGPMPYRSENIVEEMWKVPVHNTRSGGFSLYDKGTLDCYDYVVDFVWEASQKETEFPSKLSCESLINRVIKHVKDGGKYDPYMWPYMLGKLAVKAEMKAPGSNPLKCRIFFIVPYLKFLFDYLILNNGMKQTYGTNGISIGTRFKGGDAERIARKHHAYEQGYFHIEADAEKLDQSLLAAILLIVFSLPFFAQRGDVDPLWKEALMQLTAFVVNGCAVKLVKWTGDQALWVIGIMFSGMLGTSWGDSTYISLLLKCFDQYVYHRMKKENPALAVAFRRDSRLHAKDIYGDDMLLTYKILYWKYIIGTDKIENTLDLSIMSNYMKRAGGVAIKASEAFVYVEDKSGHGPFFSVVNAAGMLVHAGPKFLQRRFLYATIKDGDNVEVMAMPWRIVSDYYMKSAYTFANDDIDFYWIIKWRSLQVDTCGTNAKAYNYLEYLQRELMKVYAWDPTSLDGMIQDWISRVMEDGGDTRDSDGIRRLLKLGVKVDCYGKHMSRMELACMFMWDDAYQRMRSDANRIPFYEKSGDFSKVDRKSSFHLVDFDLSGIE